MGIKTRPKELSALQAAAAVGQMGLAQAYEQAFSEVNLNTAQILLTHDDLSDRTRYLNARATLLTLLRMGVIPVINEIGGGGKPQHEGGPAEEGREQRPAGNNQRFQRPQAVAKQFPAPVIPDIETIEPAAKIENRGY